jgi:hypothetical protein
MDATRQHALLSYILEGMSPEEQQKALVAFSSMAQGDPNTLPVQLALFVKGATKAMLEAGDRISSLKEEAPKLIEEEFAKGLLKHEELQRTLTEGLGKFLPQVEKINKGMENVPFALKQLSVCAAKAEIAAGEAASTAQRMDGKILKFSSILIVSMAVAVVVGVFLDEGLRYYFGGRSFFQDYVPYLWGGGGFMVGFIYMFLGRRLFP